jgi:hypothetical protein
MAVLPALNLHAADVNAMWGTNIGYAFRGLNETYDPENEWPLVSYDHTDTPGAGGYHINQRGLVSGKIFVADALDGGESPWVDATHEGSEMAGDPSAGTDPSKFINLPNSSGEQCLPELCDAVEADTLSYVKEAPDPGFDVPGCTRQNGKLLVPCSDFVLPQYFYGRKIKSPAWPQGGEDAYDFLGHLTSGPAPKLLYGGYLGIRLPDGEWSQVSMFRKDGTRSRRALRDGGRTSYAAAQKS